MFDIGEYVVFGTDGVCKVESIGPLDIEGVSKEKIYYTLSPFGRVGNGKIFAPVESKRVVIRKILTKDQVTSLIARIKDIAAIEIENEKKREDTYKQIMQSCDCEKLIGLLKQITIRREERLAAGKKLPAVDERYYNMAENSLYSEFSLPLNMDKSIIRDFIKGGEDPYL